MLVFHSLWQKVDLFNGTRLRAGSDCAVMKQINITEVKIRNAEWEAYDKSSTDGAVLMLEALIAQLV